MTTETLNAIADLFGIGSKVRTPSTILANVRNAARRAACLSAIEREFFTKLIEIEDEGEIGKVEECALNWGHDPDEYVKQFRLELSRLLAEAKGEPVAWIDFERRPPDLHLKPTPGFMPVYASPAIAPAVAPGEFRTADLPRMKPTAIIGGHDEPAAEQQDDLLEWVEIDGIKYKAQQEVAHALAAANARADFLYHKSECLEMERKSQEKIITAVNAELAQRKQHALEMIAERDAELARLRKEREGMVMVPREPTAAMHGAGDGVISNEFGAGRGTWIAGKVYRAMLAAHDKEPKK